MLIPPRVFETANVASKDSARYQLTGIYLAREHGKPEAVATDGKKLMVTTWKEDDNEEFPASANACIVPDDSFKAIIPTATCKRLAKWSGDKLKPILCNVAIEETDEPTLHATTTDLETVDKHSFKVIDGKYPDFSSLVHENDGDTVAFTNVDNMIEALQALKKVLGKNRVATMRLAKDGQHPIAFSARSEDEMINSTVYVMPMVAEL